jgi:hypothetical protein
LECEVSTNLLFIEGRFTIVTHVACSLTAISVVVQSLPVEVLLTTGSFWESKRVCDTTEKWQGIRELCSFEENYVRVVFNSDSSVSCLANWEKLLFIELFRV